MKIIENKFLMNFKTIVKKGLILFDFYTQYNQAPFLLLFPNVAKNKDCKCEKVK